MDGSIALSVKDRKTLAHACQRGPTVRVATLASATSNPSPLILQALLQKRRYTNTVAARRHISGYFSHSPRPCILSTFLTAWSARLMQRHV